MQSKLQNPPSRHHFIPQFLLGHWKDGDTLLRYRRNRAGEIESSPASPKSVCFERTCTRRSASRPGMANRWKPCSCSWPLDVPVSVAWLGSASSYVSLPIGPDTLFVAAGSPTLANRIVSLPERELIMRQNRSTVGHAQTFVGARSNQHGDFICANFGARSRHSMTQSIADRYKRRAI